ncbi:ParB/RepB/Spo0J family partition protein [Candidatus Paraluminiphilus aquimaris]|uniref:Probable chromosome-partitioning protein ParB n=1 Tax=Candidatus Paraluminiphilus aquimaris TaxID=2518994 RepID=A0ABY6Q633_9GAMM|nr:ParB/RepB/Spo0J family partition protein [Candidatus Paraluminiphilus aquimaris]UZP73711.1 ParB/RepB/Spo0J family partition protein [Candidatus Paraluminiphilus aquimaris]
MTTKKRKLNRGLDALLGTELTKQKGGESAPSSSSTPADGELRQIRLERLQRGKYQPRVEFDDTALNELAESIKAQGVMQPIVVRAISSDRFEIVAGERRWRASQIAGLDSIPGLVRDISDETAIAMALIENIQRENLNPMEEARALKRLQAEFELSQQEIANAVGKSRSVIANLLRLLSLEAGAAELLETGRIDAGHAKVLLALEGNHQVMAARKVAAAALSVRQTEALVKAILNPKDAEIKTKVDPDIDRLERSLSEQFGTKVSIENKNGRGRLIIQYSNLDVLDGILGRMQ